MPREVSKGKPTTRRYSPDERAAAVRMVRALRAEIGTEHGTGTVVNVSLVTMGGPMMGQRTMMGGAMRLGADRASVSAGTVSLAVTNYGSIDHELVILPLADN